MQDELRHAAWPAPGQLRALNRTVFKREPALPRTRAMLQARVNYTGNHRTSVTSFKKVLNFNQGALGDQGDQVDES